jgi:hypothetical protein
VYVDGFAGDDEGNPVVREEELVLVTDPGDAEVAVVRVNAPWEHRDDLFLEASFPDVAGGTANPLFRFGHGLDI